MLRTFAIALLLSAALAAPAFAEEECFPIIGPDPNHVTHILTPGYSITGQTPPLKPPPVDGQLQALTCVRETLRLAPNDYRVLTELNVPLLVADERRMLSLTQDDDGQLVVKVIDGALTAAEQQQIDQMLHLMQGAMHATPA